MWKTINFYGNSSKWKSGLPSKTISYSKSKRCELRKREVAVQNEQEISFNNFTEDLELSKLANEEPELLEHDLSLE